MSNVLLGSPGSTAAITAALDSTAAGQAAALVVEGEPGAGKTALLRAAHDLGTERGFRVVTVTAVEGESDLPLAGLSALAMLLAYAAAALDAPHRDALAAAAGGAAAGAAEDRFRLGAATLALLAAAAEPAPLLVLLDDVQWLDPASAAALSFALRRLAADPVLLVVATRPDALPSALALPPGTPRNRIDGLSDDDVAMLLDAADLPVIARVAAAITAATGGLPLAVLETAAALGADQRTGRVALPDPLPVGRRIAEAYRARYLALPAPAREAAALAALAGSASVDVLLRALTATGHTIAELDQVEDAGLVRLAESVTFGHPLLRAAAANLPAPSRRRTLRRALAAADPDPEHRARHLAAAATGPDDATAAALDAAAAQTRRRGAVEAAARLLADAARFTPPGPRRYERLLGAAQAFALVGNAAAARHAAEQVRGGSPVADQRSAAALVIIETSMWDTGEDVRELAIQEADRTAATDPATAVRALVHAANAATLRGQLFAAERLGARAVGIAEGLPPRLHAAAHQIHAMTLTLIGRQDTARRLLAAWQRPNADQVGAADIFPDQYPGTVQTLTRLGRYDDADALVRVLMQVCRRESAPTAQWYLLCTYIDLLWWRDEWTRAQAQSEQVTAFADEAGLRTLAQFGQAIVARINAARGEDTRCRALADEALRFAHEHENVPLAAYAHTALGYLDLGRGRYPDAANHLCEADRVCLSCGMLDPVTLPYAAELVEAHWRCGDQDVAHAKLDVLAERAAASGTAWAAAVTARCRGLLATDEDDADAEFAAALDRHPAGIAAFDAARTRLYWGERLRRRRDLPASRRLLGDAEAVFERLGARPWAQRAAAERRASGERCARKPAARATLSVLSPQELRCALAVADGLTNRQAAATLFISPKTVEQHLSKAFTKLGITNRAQLTRLVTEIGSGTA